MPTISQSQSTDTAYVYTHTRLDGVVFYVGIGTTKRRATDRHKRNQHWHNTVEKHGYTVDVVHSGLSWYAACALEVQLISFYRALYGKQLTNQTMGGEGSYGVKQTQATIDKRRPKLIGRVHTQEAKDKNRNAHIGKVTSPETKEKLRLLGTGRKQSEETIAARAVKLRGKKRSASSVENIRKSQMGKTVSDDARVKMSVAHLGKKHTPETLEKMVQVQRRIAFKRAIEKFNTLNRELLCAQM